MVKKLILFCIVIFIISCVQSEAQLPLTDKFIKKKGLTYAEIMQNIERFRKEKAQELKLATTQNEKENIKSECRDSLFIQLKDNVFPAWYGTAWAFEGITETPKIGEYPVVARVDTNRIACGYFITRIMRKMQFRINPYKIAQQNPEGIVRNFVKNEDIFYSNNESVSLLKKKLQKRGKGIYVTGLDGHVGFIVYDGDDYFRFVHSTYYDPPLKVVSEKLESYNPLNHSQNRIVGKLFNDEMINTWLLNKKFKYIKP